MALRQLVEAAFFFTFFQEKILKTRLVNPNQSVDSGAEIIKSQLSDREKIAEY